jgi:hypothetical protein
MRHLSPIPPFLVRHGSVGKPRRPVGDPVAALKDMTRFEPIPRPAPAHLEVPLDIVDPNSSAKAEKAGHLVFHAVGDTGGVNGTAAQEAIAEAMEEQIKTAQKNETPAFFYNLGEVVYYNGQSRLYKTEFDEPYQYYPALIFAMPGNHDGDSYTRKGDAPGTERL